MNEGDIKSRISAGLRSRRAEKNLNQRDLAEEIGCNPATVGAWERRAGISLEDAWKLADFYGISLDELAKRDFAHA